MSTKKLNRITWATLSLLLVALFLGGCQTWKGAGRDLERAGEGMQKD